jgi:uncharacterized protein YjiS (DUF1127 family)
MSTCSDHSMTRHHEGLITQLITTVQLWRQRAEQRHELARFSDRDLHDVGLSWSDIALEAKKPFWRA